MEMASCSTLDMLGNLPENILENIFSFLSMRDVARTSVLSTKWRYKWVSVPHFMFNDGCIPVSTGSLGHDQLVKIVNHVLLLHRGPVETFRITSSQLQTCSEIDSWILYLSLNSIKKLKLQISTSMRHNVPPCLFSSAQLNHLILIGFIIVPPVTFKGFSCLQSLYLQNVILSNAAFECLISTCPQLERLKLIDIDGPTYIEICNPKLKYFFFSGKFIGICLKNLGLLVNAYFYAKNAAHPHQQLTCNFTNVLGSLLGIQKLNLEGLFLQSLAIGYVPMRLPTTYDHLKSVSFSLNMEDMKEIFVVICLLKSTPNLQELEISFWHDRYSAIVPVMDLQEAKDQLDFAFNKLRVVNFPRLFGKEMELEVIKFILANSPVLEKMNITPEINETDKAWTLMKELLRFKRASPQAEIVYVDPKA